jgi:Porin PorA
MRKTAIASAVVGLVLLVAAGLLAWWITPSYIAQLPGNYNKTRTYDATIHKLVNPAALATGNLAAATLTGVPATLTENVKVLQTSGGSALVQDTRNISAAGATVVHTVTRYSVSRHTLEATASHPSGWNVTPAKGLTVSWPLGAKQQNYTGWVYLTDTTTTLKYVGQATQGGINTYVYRATVPPTPIKNSQVLGLLPKSLPASVVPRLAAAGLISRADVAALAKTFPGATSIPLGYTYQAVDTYYVAPGTGLVVNVANNEVDAAGVALPNGTIVPVLPVIDYSYHASPSSLSAAVSDANSGSNAISIWGVYIPIAFAALGFVLVVLAVLLWMRGRSRGRPVEMPHGQRHPSPTGRIS